MKGLPLAAACIDPEVLPKHTLLYGNHVCFGNTSGAIQTAANGNPFINGFYSGRNIIPVTKGYTEMLATFFKVNFN